MRKQCATQNAVSQDAGEMTLEKLRAKVELLSGDMFENPIRVVDALIRLTSEKVCTPHLALQFLRGLSIRFEIEKGVDLEPELVALFSLELTRASPGRAARFRKQLRGDK